MRIEDGANPWRNGAKVSVMSSLINEGIQRRTRINMNFDKHTSTSTKLS